MTLWKIPTIDYTSRDFEAIRDDIIRTIPFFTDEWTDFNPSDFGIVMIELFAGIADSLHFYVDRVYGESFLPTALTRRSVVNLTKLIDYELRGHVAATVDVKFFIDAPLAADLVIPIWTHLQTLCDRPGSQQTFSNALDFETSSELTIPAGSLVGTVGAIQGLSVGALVASSDGLANQRYVLPDNPVIEDTTRIFIDEGVGPEEWEVLDTLIESLSCDKVCTLFRDEDDDVFVNFGDNGTGKIPTANSPITAEYRIGGGAEGNVGSETITIVVDPLTVGGDVVTVSVINEAAASGGEDPQTLENAKIEAPRALRALYRAVTPEDYEALGEAQPGIGKLKAVAGHWRCSNHTACCQLSLYVVPAGGGVPSQQLKDDLVDFFDTRKAACTVVEAFDPTYQPIDITGTVIFFSNFQEDSVQADVLSRIGEYFHESDSPFTGFDKNAHLSDIYSIIDNTDGVDHVDLDAFTRHPVPVNALWGGDATFDETTWEIGEDSVYERWTITFTSPTDFNVLGTESGLQGSGVVGTDFLSTNGNVGFKIENVGDPMSAGDSSRFFTSQQLANILMAAGEFFTSGDIAIAMQSGGVGAQTRCT